MKETSFFKTNEDIIKYLRDLAKYSENKKDWAWEEGFLCGLNEAEVISDKELQDIMICMKGEE